MRQLEQRVAVLQEQVRSLTKQNGLLDLRVWGLYALQIAGITGSLYLQLRISRPVLPPAATVIWELARVFAHLVT